VYYISQLKNYYYRIYGLNLQSAIEIPEVPQCEETEPDAIIKLGKVPDQLSRPTHAGVLYELNGNDFLFKLEK